MMRHLPTPFQRAHACLPPACALLRRASLTCISSLIAAGTALAAAARASAASVAADCCASCSSPGAARRRPASAPAAANFAAATSFAAATASASALWVEDSAQSTFLASALELSSSNSLPANIGRTTSGPGLPDADGVMPAFSRCWDHPPVSASSELPTDSACRLQASTSIGVDGASGRDEAPAGGWPDGVEALCSPLGLAPSIGAKQKDGAVTPFPISSAGSLPCPPTQLMLPLPPSPPPRAPPPPPAAPAAIRPSAPASRPPRSSWRSPAGLGIRDGAAAVPTGAGCAAGQAPLGGAGDASAGRRDATRAAAWVRGVPLPAPLRSPLTWAPACRCAELASFGVLISWATARAAAAGAAGELELAAAAEEARAPRSRADRASVALVSATGAASGQTSRALVASESVAEAASLSSALRRAAASRSSSRRRRFDSTHSSYMGCDGMGGTAGPRHPDQKACSRISSHEGRNVGSFCRSARCSSAKAHEAPASSGVGRVAAASSRAESEPDEAKGGSPAAMWCNRAPRDQKSEAWEKHGRSAGATGAAVLFALAVRAESDRQEWAEVGARISGARYDGARSPPIAATSRWGGGALASLMWREAPRSESLSKPEKTSAAVGGWHAGGEARMAWWHAGGKARWAVICAAGHAGARKKIVGQHARVPALGVRRYGVAAGEVNLGLGCEDRKMEESGAREHRRRAKYCP
eukprot:scaffold21487_cov105-Isochrysis_galbana.AAC.11